MQTVKASALDTNDFRLQNKNRDVENKDKSKFRMSPLRVFHSKVPPNTPDNSQPNTPIKYEMYQNKLNSIDQGIEVI